MKRIFLGTAVLLSLIFVACKTINSGEAPTRAPSSVNYDSSFIGKGYAEAHNRQMADGYKLSDSQVAKEVAGRTIWYKSAPNGRFHTYAFSQKLGTPVNWFQVLRSDMRGKRFNVWGIMNDPDCCTPGEDCERRQIKTATGKSPTMGDTFGFDFCPGDDYMAQFVGRPEWDYTERDPACYDPLIRAADALDKGNARESSCHLAFGQSTGAVGFRKFPNPQFRADRWQKIGGWEGYENRGFDGSVEPPFRVAISCASCHASFDPVHPPKDLNSPQWSNISGTTGNPYIRITDILTSGTAHDSLESQLFTPISRPGTSDTSAVPNDLIGNPGTINAIINIPVRPQFTDKVKRWFHVASCDPSQADCQVIKYASGEQKFWKLETRNMKLFHILKGGEDSVGPDLAVQRVYLNIGMCAEQCWMNHLTDLHNINPTERNFGQTPFDIKQCRRDCAPWRANEDRVGDIFSFLLSARPSDLKEALVNTGVISNKTDGVVDESKGNFEFVSFIENTYGKGALNRGKTLYSKNCASCHSSQPESAQEIKADFHRVTTLFRQNLEKTESGIMPMSFPIADGEKIRVDWLGNDKSTKQTAIKTYACRAAHTNHMKGQIWEEFASETYGDLGAVLFNNLRQPITGGPGYYRNISLLNVWAYAPFMHNNAMGPEICGRPEGGPELHKNTYEGKQIVNGRGNKVCDEKFDPSIGARLRIFDKSMDELLTPESRRVKKIAVTTETVRLPLGVSPLSIGRSPARSYLEIPPGTPLARIGNFNIKLFLSDMMGSVPHLKNADAFNKYWQEKFGADEGLKMANAVRGTIKRISDIVSLDGTAAIAGGADNFIKELNKEIADRSNERLTLYLNNYQTCQVHYENMGHNILTEGLNEQDRRDLKAFLATL